MFQATQSFVYKILQKRLNHPVCLHQNSRQRLRQAQVNVVSNNYVDVCHIKDKTNIQFVSDYLISSIAVRLVAYLLRVFLFCFVSFVNFCWRKVLVAFVLSNSVHLFIVTFKKHYMCYVCAT